MYENIAAISTAPGTGGVAIIRISGNAVLQTAEKMFRPTGKTAVKDFVPYKMYPGEILADGFTDYGLCVFFKAPHSYTGEDTVEFQCHGGTAIARGVLKATLANGCRLAEKGEFTKRAFLHGKLSLSSAEGVIDMINGQSQSELKAGYFLYSEKLTKQIKSLQDRLTLVMAGIEADIDYPEEEVEAESLAATLEELKLIHAELARLVASYSVGKKIKHGVNCAIAGKPNTGKSSLLNALLGYEKAIVSDVAGTTRDTVEGSMDIDGVRFNLYDTAGIRKSDDKIEAIGIDRAKRMTLGADVILFVLDSSAPYTEEDKLVYESIREKPHVVVYNKTDKDANALTDAPKADIRISAATGENLDSLCNLLRERGAGTAGEGNFLTEERHYAALKEAAARMEKVLHDFELVPTDMLTIELSAAWEKLGEISGETANERIIDEIFSKFCVGK